MFEKCMRCGSTNLATLGGDKQVCVECGWHSANMSKQEVTSVILKYYEDECEGK